MVIGSPFATSQAIHERLTEIKALPIFSSDALSSSAYGPEEVLIALALAGSGALSAALPIVGVIVLLLAIVTLSYRQTIKAYPSGGGAYIVAHENLGQKPGLTAASALMVDYVLTVAVSVAAGVAAITSAAPGLYDARVPIGVLVVALFALGQPEGHPGIGHAVRLAHLFLHPRHGRDDRGGPVQGGDWETRRDRSCTERRRGSRWWPPRG